SAGPPPAADAKSADDVTAKSALPQYLRMNLHRMLWVVVAVSLTGCVHGRYTMPVSRYDAHAIYPSVVSVAQQQGHQAWLNGENLQVELSDGTRLIWYPQNDSTVGLGIKLAGEVPAAEEAPRVAAAKEKADKLWQDALSARQLYGAGAAVPVLVVAAGSAPALPSDCKFGSDGQKVCGYDCRLGSNGRAYCASTPDGRCAMNTDGTVSCGRDCRMQANGRNLCN
ncbi:MAG: hypothetical protein ACT4TC_09785, partial [Myxococcaceae bacterium]